jgi:ABC-type sulfate/molybdate transport systems ATPase subunit
MRTFRREPAVRASVPLLVALIGPSGSGKTFSALRLATGIQRVQEGPTGSRSTMFLSKLRSVRWTI